MGGAKGYSHTQLMEEYILSKPSFFKKKEQSLESTRLAPFSIKLYQKSLSLSLSQHLEENLCLYHLLCSYLYSRLYELLEGRILFSD